MGNVTLTAQATDRVGESGRRRGAYASPDRPRAVPEAVAVAVHLQDVDVVGQAVQQRAGEAFRAEDLSPLVEGQVGGDQDGAPRVALPVEPEIPTSRKMLAGGTPARRSGRSWEAGSMPGAPSRSWRLVRL